MDSAIDTEKALGATSRPLASMGMVSPIRVVAVDGNETYRDMLSNELPEQGFAVTAFPDTQAILAAPDLLSAADLMVLEWGLSPNSGLDLLRQLRRQGVSLPIVFLTHRFLANSEALALGHGAIDFIDKSRGVAILALRLRICACLKVPRPERGKVLQLGRLLLKPHISRAFWEGIDVNLTLGEFKIVNLLASNADHHISYREIYDALRHHGFIAGCGENGYRTNVRSAIKRARRKFEALDPAFDRIQNYTAFGYIWAREGTAPER